MKKLTTLVSVLALSASVAAPFAAFADTVNVSADVSGGHAKTGLGTKLEMHMTPKTDDSQKPDRMGKGQDRGDAMIEARLSSLGALKARISGAKRLSDSDKAALEASIDTTIADLTALKAQIASDTSTTTLKGDVESIKKTYRVYALVMPRAAIEAAADRIDTITAEMDTFGTKLQARISDMKSQGLDTTAAESAYADYTAKVSLAKTDAQAAVTAVASLSSDQGDQATFTANVAALKSARDQIKAAEAALKAARADAATIMGTVKGHGKDKTEVTASSTTTVQ